MRRIAFLFLGETHLIPHLFPLLIATARQRPDMPIDAWVPTSVHADLLRQFLAGEKLQQVRLRPTINFREMGSRWPDGRNPPLPSKVATLVLNAFSIARYDAVVCAERTSLWIPRFLPGCGRFLFTFHGAGPFNKWRDTRNLAAWRLLVPSEDQRRLSIEGGVDPDRVVVTGYAKAHFKGLAARRELFANGKPVVVYAPHWERHRSSWWDWGTGILNALAQQREYNVIFAPHLRLVEKAPEVREIAGRLNALDHVHADIESFAMVDGSYMGAADIYLGDSSSQVVEFLVRPRPCVFVNSKAVDWQGDASYTFWNCGDVVNNPAEIMRGIVQARARHALYEQTQRDFVVRSLGNTGEEGLSLAVTEIISAADGLVSDAGGF